MRQTETVFWTKLCLSLTVILWKCHFIVATGLIIGNNINNICENVADHIFIQDIEDCTKYFVCINGQANSQQCRAGLYFDASRQACSACRQSCLQCPPGRMMNVPLVKTCNKYISCYYGQSLLKKCENDLQFNVKTGKCDLAKNIDCVDNRCSIYATDKDLAYIPSAASCDKYFICLAGTTKLLTCADGLYFNTKCNCCDKPENVQCLAKDFETPTEKIKQNKHNTSYLQLKYTPNFLGETNKVKCPPKGHFLYQYIENPDYYFTCVNGKASLYACANGSQFDDKLKRCISPEKEHHLNANTSEINSTEHSNYDAVLNEFSGIVCPKFATFTFPHVEKQKFYLCLNGKVSIFTCDEGQYFDDSNHGCSEELFRKETNEKSSAAQDNIKCPISGNTTLPHALSNQYYLCLEGKAAIFSCASGLYYDVNLKSCSKSISSTSGIDIFRPELNAASVMCPRFGTFKFPHLDQTKFYLCIDGKTYILTCAHNEIFIADINACGKHYTSELEGNNDSITINNNNTQPSSVVCPKFGTFMFPYNQKSQYYVCVDGNAIGFACTGGHIFDDKTNSCQRDFTLSESSENQKPVVLDEPVHILCPTIGVMKFAHKNKNTFYLCINGMGSVLACAEGSFFEAETGNCLRTFDLKIATSETAPDTTEAVRESSIECPIAGTFIYPHIDKNRYSVCLEGVSIVLTCPGGLIFDSYKKACHAPKENKYAKNQPPVVLDEMVNIMCPASGAYKFPHVEKNKFYLCINGMGSIFACPKDSNFESNTGICHKNMNSSESYEDIEEIFTNDSGESSKMNCPEFGTFLYPHEDKNRYFVCLDGSAFDLACSKGLTFNSEVNACIKDSSEVNYNKCPKKGTYKLPHADRNKFYLCMDGIAVIDSCTKGDFFDAESETCREDPIIENEDYQNTTDSVDREDADTESTTYSGKSNDHDEISHVEEKNYTTSQLADNQ